MDHRHHPGHLDPDRSSPDFDRYTMIRILAIVLIVITAVHLWQGIPEVRAYMAADDLAKTDYLIAKMNRQPFEFPSKP
jgi:hypothetical protein